MNANISGNYHKHKRYRFFDVAIESILQPKYFKDCEDNAHNSPHWNSVLHVEVQETVDLAACEQVDFDDGIVPVEVDQLLKEQRRRDLRFCIDRTVHSV